MILVTMFILPLYQPRYLWLKPLGELIFLVIGIPILILKYVGMGTLRSP